MLLSGVKWIEKTEIVDNLLRRADTLVMLPMAQGFEAEVVKIQAVNESFVYKVWNKGSKPDIQFQYQLLHVLFECDIPVSKPFGWGVDRNGDQVLLTSFDGAPVHNGNARNMADLANILVNLHRLGIEDMGNLQLPKHDFSSYFFPEASLHPDINETLQSIISTFDMKQDRIIHGDYHSNNILENNGRYTIIDWTNGQLGDSRYDFAWSHFLLHVYHSKPLADVFRAAYLSEHDIARKELAAFEALACLRWMLLSRTGGAPAGPEVSEKAGQLRQNNPILKKFNFKEK